MIQPHIKFCAWRFGEANANPGVLWGVEEEGTLSQGWKKYKREKEPKEWN